MPPATATTTRGWTARDDPRGCRADEHPRRFPTLTGRSEARHSALKVAPSVVQGYTFDRRPEEGGCQPVRRTDGRPGCVSPRRPVTAPGGTGTRVAQSGVPDAVLEGGHAWTMRSSSVTYARSARPRAIVSEDETRVLGARGGSRPTGRPRPRGAGAFLGSTSARGKTPSEPGSHDAYLVKSWNWPPSGDFKGKRSFHSHHALHHRAGQEHRREECGPGTQGPAQFLKARNLTTGSL
jgi:hypothetical protein